MGNVVNRPISCDAIAALACESYRARLGFPQLFQSKWTFVRILNGNWHVDCSIIMAERGRRVPKLQTPIGVESATWRFLAESEALA